jgi:hypothetical protein
VRHGSLSKEDFKAGRLPAGAAGLPGTPGAPGLTGPKGDPGEPGAARAYAFVSSTGAVDESRSEGVADANVSAVGNTYCFSGLRFTPPT